MIRSRIRKTPLLLAIAVVVAATALIPGPVAAGTDSGKVTVVHAVPDLTVDVYANKALLLEDFDPGTITDPVPLAPATYNIEVTPADSSTVVLAASVPVDAETDAAAVAHLDEAGNPTLGLFANNIKSIERNRARVTVRHTAAAPEVAVRFQRSGRRWQYLTKDIMNGEQAKRGFRARTYNFDVVLAGTKDRVLGPVTLALEPGTHYFVYAWGSASDGSLALNLSTRDLPVR